MLGAASNRALEGMRVCVRHTRKHRAPRQPDDAGRILGRRGHARNAAIVICEYGEAASEGTLRVNQVREPAPLCHALARNRRPFTKTAPADSIPAKYPMSR
jgi:hypothetical protein